MKKIAIWGASLLFLFYLAFIHYTDTTHTGIRWNWMSGEIKPDPKPGFHCTAPWVMVTRIENTPIRVCIESAGRAVNCRLVQFIPDEYKALIAAEGFRYYWWDNRISFNLGYKEEYRGTRDLLRGYAFSVQEYPFIKTMTTYSE